MLQRIQSIYLFLAAIVTIGLPFLLPLWYVTNRNEYYFYQNNIYFLFFVLSGILSFISIFLFKKRQNQFVVNRLNIILNLILLGLFVNYLCNVSGDSNVVSEKGIGVFLPILVIVLLVVANKAIKKDEDLVKSVDRLR